VIIASSVLCDVDDIIRIKPRVLIFGPDNEIIDRVVYDVFRRDDGELDMAVRTLAASGEDYGFPQSLITRSAVA
jgi:aspartate 1-decarboxylase